MPLIVTGFPREDKQQKFEICWKTPVFPIFLEKDFGVFPLFPLLS
jgi:hypothetical protein